MAARARHIMIVVTDLERALAFYQGVLGLELVAGEHHRLGLADGFEIHLCDVNPADPASYMGGLTADAEAMPVYARSFSQAATHLAIEVHDVRTVLRRLLDAGSRPFQLDSQGEGGSGACRAVRIEHRDDPLSLGSRTVYTYDPDGNLVEIGESGLSTFL